MSKLIVRHRTLGKVEITVDPEDLNLLKSAEVYIKSEKGRDVPSYLMVVDNGKRVNASRWLLKKHKQLRKGRHVFFGEKGSFDLTKANLFQYS